MEEKLCGEYATGIGLSAPFAVAREGREFQRFPYRWIKIASSSTTSTFPARKPPSPSFRLYNAPAWGSPESGVPSTLCFLPQETIIRADIKAIPASQRFVKVVFTIIPRKLHAQSKMLSGQPLNLARWRELRRGKPRSFRGRLEAMVARGDQERTSWPGPLSRLR